MLIVEVDNALKERGGGSVANGNEDGIHLDGALFPSRHIPDNGTSDNLLLGNIQIVLGRISISIALTLDDLTGNLSQSRIPSNFDGRMLHDPLRQYPGSTKLVSSVHDCHRLRRAGQDEGVLH